MRKRGGRKRALGTRAPMTIPQAPNQRWSLDFVADVLTDGRRFRILVRRRRLQPGVPGAGRRQLARPVGGSPASSTAIAELRGLPLMIVSDNGTELTSHAILGWQAERGVDWHYIAPGKPMQNGFVESLIGRLRDECLNEHLFTSLPAPAHIDRALADRLQHPAPAHEPRRAHPIRLCQPVHHGPQPRPTLVMIEGNKGAGSLRYAHPQSAATLGKCGESWLMDQDSRLPPPVPCQQQGSIAQARRRSQIFRSS